MLGARHTHSVSYLLPVQHLPIGLMRGLHSDPAGGA